MRRFDFFSDAFYPDWTGGLQRYATELAATASAQGHDAVLWTREWRVNGLKDVSEVVGAGARVQNLTANIPRLLRGPWLTAAAILGIGRRSVPEGCRIFHTSVLGAAYMRRGSNDLQIYVFHASAGHELLAEAKSAGNVPVRVRVKAAILLRLERKCLLAADAVVVLSEFSRGLLKELHPHLAIRNITLIPGGTHIPQSGTGAGQLGLAPRSRRIVVLRRLEWRMGIDLLLRAFAGSRAREHGWSIDIVGTGSQELSLRGLAEELGLSDSVTFHGRVSEPEKVELLEAATLSILPTRALEGFGLATVEAMALGVVPIVTSAGASPEVVQDLDGRLVCDPTADSIRTALDYWAVDASSETIRRISVACRERAKRYGWQSVFTAYQELVTRLSQPAQRA